MRRPLPPLNGLRAFEAAARHLSFQDAALELNVTPAAVGQSIRALEAHLGLPLFKRMTRQVVLTDAGQVLAPYMTGGFGQLADGIGRLRALDNPDRLTLTTTISFAEKWLLPRLPDFGRLYPDLDVRIISTDKRVDFTSDHIDLAIRFGRGVYKGMIAEAFTDNIYSPVCAPELLRAAPGIARPEDLYAHTLIHTDWLQESNAAPSWEGWFGQAGLALPKTRKELHLSVETLAVNAAVDGLGVALVHDILVQSDLEKGLLVKPFGNRYTIVPTFKYFIVYPEARQGDRRIETIRTWLFDNARVGAPARGATMS